MPNQKNPTASIIARAWKDPAFKKRLLSDPYAALKEMGFDLGKGVTVKVVEDANGAITLVLPPAPVNVKELDDIYLEKLAAGGTDYTHGCTCTHMRPED